MEWLIELIKVVVPMSLLVLLAYLILSQQLKGQLRLKSIELQRERKKDTLELKLNAYERLSLYVERISFPNLIIRMNNGKLTTDELYTSLLVTIQKEFEHNLSQQIYVSENLWHIIALAKQDLTNLITEVYADHQNKSTDQYINHLVQQYAIWQMNPVESAKSAIRQEAALLL